MYTSYLRMMGENFPGFKKLAEEEERKMAYLENLRDKRGAEFAAAEAEKMGWAKDIAQKKAAGERSMRMKNYYNQYGQGL